jgi:anti-sigma regulatory factor (Ser/Thr protein kinase)
MLLSLCVEEIIVNTVKFGFTNGKQKHSAEVRLVVDDEKCIIRIRDNCIGFDPTKYFELHEYDSPTDHIGIRMVMKMVNEIDYINSLGLNNLYMSINR